MLLLLIHSIPFSLHLDSKMLLGMAAYLWKTTHIDYNMLRRFLRDLPKLVERKLSIFRCHDNMLKSP